MDLTLKRSTILKPRLYTYVQGDSILKVGDKALIKVPKVITSLKGNADPFYNASFLNLIGEVTGVISKDSRTIVSLNVTLFNWSTTIYIDDINLERLHELGEVTE